MLLLHRMSQTDDIDTALARAAKLAAKTAVSSDDFMAAAWQAYLDSHPGMREELEDKALRSELKKLRKRGLVAAA
jgi:hypothetical protein